MRQQLQPTPKLWKQCNRILAKYTATPPLSTNLASQREPLLKKGEIKSQNCSIHLLMKLFLLPAEQNQIISRLKGSLLPINSREITLSLLPLSITRFLTAVNF